MEFGGTFESVTKVAISEIINNHTRESKFGHLISPEEFEGLVNDLFSLLAMSRSLKSAGDKMLANAGQTIPDPAARRR